MNITDIQIRLRKIGEELTLLEGALEELKPKDKKAGKDVYKNIDILAGKNPICNNRLAKEEDILKKYYIQFLSIIANMDKRNYEDKLLYITRLARGIGYEGDAKDIEMLGVDISNDIFENIVRFTDKYNYNIIADGLIVADINGEAEDDVISLISGMAGYMGCSKEDMRVISTVAVCMLENEFDRLNELDINTNKWMGVFSDQIPEEWLIKNRVYYKRLYDKSCYSDDREFPYIMDDYKASSIVKKGNILEGIWNRSSTSLGAIFTWMQPKNIEKKENGKKVENNGILYMKESKYENDKKAYDVYIVSLFDDMKKVKEWVRKQKKG